jgi:hypothetical protein
MTVLTGKFSTFDIATINGGPTPDIATRLEEHLRRERELGVWSYPHFVRYLRAIIYKLTPEPHHCTRMVLDAADEIIAEKAAPRRLAHLITMPPTSHGRGRAAREAANAICEIIGYWSGYQGVTLMRADDQRLNYERALGIAKSAERGALDVNLTADELYECAVAANTDAEIDADRRDAAIAAMSVGHFKLAHDIATDAPGEKS